jgi:hypothetical protein
MSSEIVDQLAHFAAGAVIVTGAVLIPAPWCGGFLGLVCGLVREITEGGNVLSRGSVIDMIFWTAGGLAAGIVLT